MEPNTNNSVDPNSYQQFGTQYGQQPPVQGVPNQPPSQAKKSNTNSAQNSLTDC